jgi:hypothetical protein
MRSAKARHPFKLTCHLCDAAFFASLDLVTRVEKQSQRSTASTQRAPRGKKPAPTGRPVPRKGGAESKTSTETLIASSRTASRILKNARFEDLPGGGR